VRKNQVLNISQTLSDFFLWCSGTDLDVLAKCPYSEISRRQQLGASVFLTAIIAYFASYYSLNLLSMEIWLIGLLSFVWSTSIFLLNRFIFLIPLIKYDLSNNKIRIKYTTLIVLVAIKSITAVIIATPFQVRRAEPWTGSAECYGGRQHSADHIPVSALQLVTPPDGICNPVCNVLCNGRTLACGHNVWVGMTNPDPRQGRTSLN